MAFSCVDEGGAPLASTCWKCTIPVLLNNKIDLGNQAIEQQLNDS